MRIWHRACKQENENDLQCNRATERERANVLARMPIFQYESERTIMNFNIHTTRALQRMCRKKTHYTQPNRSIVSAFYSILWALKSKWINNKRKPSSMNLMPTTPNFADFPLFCVCVWNDKNRFVTYLFSVISFWWLLQNTRTHSHTHNDSLN